MSVFECATVKKKTVNFSADQLQTVTENFLASVAFVFLVVVVAVNKSGMQKFPHTHAQTHTVVV